MTIDIIKRMKDMRKYERVESEILSADELNKKLTFLDTI